VLLNLLITSPLILWLLWLGRAWLARDRLARGVGSDAAALRLAGVGSVGVYSLYKQKTDDQDVICG